MIYKKVNSLDLLEIYYDFYRRINGGIDGYYEKVILEGDIYVIENDNFLDCFSIHNTRGLTSLVVLPDYEESYSDIFSFVIQLSLFDNFLFTENDNLFKKHIEMLNIPYEKQAYNFDVMEKIVSNIVMKKVTKVSII